MLIKWGSIVVKGSGKLGGHVYSTTRTGATVRTNGNVKNPKSRFQELVRGEFTILTQNWRQLTNEQRNSWRNAEDAFTRTNRFGDVVRLTGKNLYESLNFQRSVISLPPLLFAPDPIQLGVNGIANVVFDVSASSIDITGTFEEQGKYVVIATKVISDGIDFVQNRTRVVKVEDGRIGGGGVGDPANVYDGYEARFGEPNAGDKVFIGTYAINEIGQRSPSSVVGVTII